eukprot:Sdes_comp22923_c0_seq1m21291
MSFEIYASMSSTLHRLTDPQELSLVLQEPLDFERVLNFFLECESEAGELYRFIYECYLTSLSEPAETSLSSNHLRLGLERALIAALDSFPSFEVFVKELFSHVESELSALFQVDNFSLGNRHDYYRVNKCLVLFFGKLVCHSFVYYNYFLQMQSSRQMSALT